MATIQEIKTKLLNANALGRTNLSKNGVELSETATTYEIMQGILNVGAPLNIAYGETAPEDTGKLWVKATKPNNVSVDSDLNIIDKIRISNAHLPIASSNMGCASVGAKIYLFGGYYGGYLNKINVFDTTTETITTLSTRLPTMCSDMGCASVGAKIYLFGGYYGSGNLNTINVFDTTNETITTLSATLPTACYDMACASVGNKIYLFGGSGAMHKINVFDTINETITTLSATLPVGYLDIDCASIGDKIYLFGGLDQGSYYKDTINVFDTATETISTLSATLPTACYGMGCVSFGTKIYLFGGDSGDYLSTINMFDTETETITTLPTTLPTACCHMGCAALGTKIYLLGGETDSSALNIINIFYKAHELKQGDIKIQSGSLTNKFNLINTKNTQIKIGVEKVYIGNTNNEAELCEAYMHNGTEWKLIS